MCIEAMARITLGPTHLAVNALALALVTDAFYFVCSRPTVNRQTHADYCARFTSIAAVFSVDMYIILHI